MEEEEATSGRTSVQHSVQHWPVFGHKLPKSQIVYFTQVIILYTVIITSIVNLTILKTDDASGKLWTALLSSSIGYILPNPSLKVQPSHPKNVL